MPAVPNCIECVKMFVLPLVWPLLKNEDLTVKTGIALADGLKTETVLFRLSNVLAGAL